MNAIDKFLADNSTTARTARSILQGALAVGVSFLPQLVSGSPLDPGMQGFVVALAISVMTPVFSMLGGKVGSDGKLEVSSGETIEKEEAVEETEEVKE